MEIIEKEKIVEHQDGYYGPNKRDINGKANAGLTLGIIGTALGAWALFGNRRAGLLGGSGLGSGLGGANIKKYVGEKFDMSKAKEVCERYRGIIPQSVTHADVYVAINAQYHDYCELFKAWFGDNIDTKIIESAINFWFKDDDYKGGCKIWKYFKEA